MQQTSSTGIAQLLSTVDLRTLVPQSLVAGAGVRYVQMRCILHNDNKPSMSVYPDGAYCYACGRQLNPQQFIEKLYNLTTVAAVEELIDQYKVAGTYKPEAHDPEYHTPDQSLAHMFHMQLNDQAVEYYLSRGLTLETIERYQLGWGRLNPYCPEGYTIPIYTVNAKGDHTLRQVKLRVPNASESKYRSMSGCGTWLYLADDAAWQDRVILVEGEFDAILLRQLGYTAVTPTGGVLSFRQHWTEQLKGSILYCGYDDDDAGNQGHKRLEQIFQKPLRRVKWKERSTDPFKDPTDAYLTHDEDYIAERITRANERFITRTTVWNSR
jgi:DNA primase